MLDLPIFKILRRFWGEFYFFLLPFFYFTYYIMYTLISTLFFYFYLLYWSGLFLVRDFPVLRVTASFHWILFIRFTFLLYFLFYLHALIVLLYVCVLSVLFS